MKLTITKEDLRQAILKQSGLDINKMIRNNHNEQI